MASNRFAACDDYGLRHLASHLYVRRGNPARRRALYALISRSFMREKQRRTMSHRSFLDDFSLVIDAASIETPINFYQEVKGSFLTAVLNTSTASLSPEHLTTLVDLGQGERATELASLIQNERMPGSLEATGVLKTDADQADALAMHGGCVIIKGWSKKAQEIAVRIQDTKRRLQVLINIPLSILAQGEKENALLKWAL